MAKNDVAVLGGGASGLTAAISAGRRGLSVLVLEKMPQPGKKILATGSGRCNFMNERLECGFYNAEARVLTESVFGRFGKAQILEFFRELGLYSMSEDGRMFPMTNQAVSVLEVLKMEIRRLKNVVMECSSDIKQIIRTQEGFRLLTRQGKSFEASAVILAAGGRSYPALGSDGSGYALAQALGHTVIEPVPSTVPLMVKDPWCHALQGLRMAAETAAVIAGKTVRTAKGEILFTKYGLSGTAILDISEELSIASHRHRQKDLEVRVDFLPSFNREVLKEELRRRLGRGIQQEKRWTGFLPEKMIPWISSQKNAFVTDAEIIKEIETVKARTFRVEGTRGWNEAEFTAGGIAVSEINPNTLESLKSKGLFLAGEILDVQGRRGGYNLAWAWASGYIAGLTQS